MIKIVGNSMLPIISNGDSVSFLKKDNYQLGDVIIFFASNSLIAHRIVKTLSNKSGYIYAYITRGDFCDYSDGIIYRSRVLGAVENIYTKKKIISSNGVKKSAVRLMNFRQNRVFYEEYYNIKRKKKLHLRLIRNYNYFILQIIKIFIKKGKSIKMENVLKIINEFVEFTATRKGIDINSYLLFGSYANGTNRPDSDIDILIITNSSGTCRGNKVHGGKLIEYFIFSKEDFEQGLNYSYKKNDLFLINTLRNSIILSDKDNYLSQHKQKALEHVSPVKETPVEVVSNMKYSIWESVDKLSSSYKNLESISVKYFQFLMDNTLKDIIGIFSASKGLSKIRLQDYYAYYVKNEKKIYDNILNDETINKQLKDYFISEKIEKQYQIFLKIADYMLNNLGGFNIDGWEV